MTKKPLHPPAQPALLYMKYNPLGKKVVDFGKPLLQSLWGNLLKRRKSCSRKLWMGQAIEERLFEESPW